MLLLDEGSIPSASTTRILRKARPDREEIEMAEHVPVTTDSTVKSREYHLSRARELLENASNLAPSNEHNAQVGLALQAAQVHATLAQVAATVVASR